MYYFLLLLLLFDNYSILIVMNGLLFILYKYMQIFYLPYFTDYKPHPPRLLGLIDSAKHLYFLIRQPDRSLARET